MTFQDCEMKFITTSNNIPGFSMTRMYLVPCKFFCSQYCLVDDVRKQNLPICTEFKSYPLIFNCSFQSNVVNYCRCQISIPFKESWCSTHWILHVVVVVVSFLSGIIIFPNYNTSPTPPPPVLHSFRNYHGTFYTDLCYMLYNNMLLQPTFLICSLKIW